MDTVNTDQQEKRSLKIKAKYRDNRYETVIVPELILSGNWLKKLGFLAEERVCIVAKQGMIIIRPE